ncbi:MAG: preprotein translocase subunit YajC [Proteobacteria bacterium]|nr:preprotein translocase subunit YajC [Pseudomonadota bacterium]MBW3618494.1 preprotein translocase subunit YajC [Pseudomonadota bacterium]
MFASPAYAQAATDAASTGGLLAGPLGSILPILLLLPLFYFLLIRPQQRRLKQHQAMISAVKRGDSVVLSNGMIGKVVRVEDAEVQVEIAPNTNVRVVKAMIGEVRAKGEPVPANDASQPKSARG